MPAQKTRAQQMLTDVSRANIFSILGLDDLTDKDKSVLLEKMLTIIYQRVVERLITALSDEDLYDLNTALANEDERATTAVLVRNGFPLFSEMMAEEAVFFKYEMNALQKGDIVKGQ